MIDPARVIVALDVLDERRALDLVDRLVPVGIRWFKVGLSLWIHSGRPIVKALQDRDVRVFLDLKLHDIPHQVGLATAAASELGVDLITLHAAGGRAMMQAAVAGRQGPTKLLAITVLTSLETNTAKVLDRATSARDAGVDGIVCSPLEVGAVRDRLRPPFLLVTPGVRLAGGRSGDQARVATPEEAIASGSDLLVIGRPIVQAPDPVAAARAMTGA